MSLPSACPECLRRAWLLARLGPYIERTLSGERSGPLELLRLRNDDLAAAVAPKVAEQICSEVAGLSEDRLAAQLRDAKCWAVCRHDPRFPVGLLEAAERAPWALIGRGDPLLLERLRPERTVTVVGARRASIYGREVARELGRDLADAGLLVTSGLAFGVDACVHRGALEVGTTVAVLGCGADIAYPASHRSLWRRICEEGLVVSELPPGTGAWRWTFPARNRIMAALSGMTVVVEAARRSGSLLTAGIASELGRELGAVPGSVNSRASVGPNDLLAGGACLVRDAQDVLDAILEGARASRPAGALAPTKTIGKEEGDG